MKNTNSGFSSLNLTAIAIVSGLIAALHMGKVPGALSRIIDDLSLTLPQSGLVVSSFSLLAALFGLAIGLLSGRLGMRRAGVLGLVLAGVGSLIGASTDDFGGLLGSRILEGFGFVIVAITMPGVIVAVCPEPFRALALGIWGAFIPAAMCLALLVSPPLIGAAGWEGLWQVAGGLSLLWGGVYLLSFRRAVLPAESRGISWNRIRPLLTGAPIIVVLAFVCYSFAFGAFTAFLPTYWEATGQSAERAARLAAIAVSGNIAGNITAGVLTGRGVTLKRLMQVSMLGVGICAGLVFSGLLTHQIELFAAIGFTALGGLLPGAVMANVGVVAEQPERIPLLVGLVFQGAGIGQVFGPALLGSAVGWSDGWTISVWVFAGIAICGLALCARLR